MHVSSLALLLLLLRSSLQESGYPPEEYDDEELENETQSDFDCFSKIRIEKVFLLCNVTKPPRKVKNIIFKIGKREIQKPWKENKHVKFSLDLGAYDVCMVWEKSRHCENINVNKIAIPDSPNNITITYNRDSEEYVFNISLPYKSYEYLWGSLNHELVLRKEGTPWPDCKDETTGGYKLCFKKIKDDFYVPRRNLEYSTKYEARVRSIPSGGFYEGSWSPWSAKSTFQTEKEPVSDTGVSSIALQDPHLLWSGGNILPVTLSISIAFFLLITVILIAVFWKSRIKPFIWPEIPDHKKALEKFCNKPKQNFHISFNPDYYEIIPIHKIDYIKAKEIPEDIPEIGTTDSSMEKASVNACNIPLSPSEGSRRLLSNNNGQCKNLEDHGEKISEGLLNSGTVALLPGDGVLEKCNPSNSSNGITSVAVKHPGNGLKGLCWEDIYIAMSAFKTPSNAVKQVPKNTF